jgi:hypothetical protein
LHSLTAPENSINRRLAESDEVLGKECSTCLRALEFNMFRLDSSKRDGRALQCTICESQPRLSTQEHVSRLTEMNNNSEGTKRQRRQDQDEYKNDVARIGHPMTHTEFLGKVTKLTDALYFEQGRVEGDLALYRVYGRPQEHLEGKQFRYIGYCPTGYMPEFSLWEFDEVRDILIREKLRGWRTVLLNLIKHQILTEAQVNEHFGVPTTQAGFIYRRELWRMRNRKNG